MEAASVGAGEKNHLQNVLTQQELRNLSAEVISKVNVYIEQTCDEYLTSKALHETGKAQIDSRVAEFEAKLQVITLQYEEASSKLSGSETTSAELSKQLESLNKELENAQDKISRLENEVISLKSSRDAAIDERNDLTRILQRRDAEVQRLTASEAALAQQLRGAIDSKCEALALNDEIQSKELSLQYKEKRIDQERVLLNSQITGLTEEVNRLTSELQTTRLNTTSRMVNLEAQLSEKIEELNAANETITQLNDVKKNLTNRAENLSQRLMEQREVENKMAENYKMELDAKSKLADLFKNMLDDAESKTMEMSEGIAELQKLLNEATEKYGDLETKLRQAEMDHEEIIEKKNEIISSLKNEIEHANDLLKASNAHNLDMALSDIAPSAATASKLLKSGMSLTQVYSQLVKVSEELAQEKDENRRLQTTINTIVQELEEKAPLLQKQRAEYEEALESNAALTQQIDSFIIECNRLRDDYNESSKIANHYSRENSRLKGELADLGRQVCFLLKEIEQSRSGPIPNGDHDMSQTASNTNSSDHSSSRVISKTLVTFSDIQEMQTNNQKLLRMVRELTEKKEEFERNKEQFESGEMQDKIDALKNRINELTDAQDRQTKMVNGLIRQRDMFKKLYHDLMKGKRHENLVLDPSDMDSGDSLPMDTSLDKSNKTVTPDPTALEVRYKDLEKQLEMTREEYKTYKEEKVTNERLLFEQIDSMRQELSKLTAANSKCASTTEYNNERLKILQTNITTYKKQITSLEEKNKAYSTTIAKHEVSLQHLRDEALNAQGKLAAAEVTVENLKLEVKLLKDTELRLQTEKDVLSRERQGQALLLKNLELIKASLERVEVENHSRLESRLDEATRECAALRRRLQEEQDRFRELASHLERQTETAKSRMQEEKAAADVLRTDVEELRQNLAEKKKANEELLKKLKMALAPNSDGSFDAMKKIKELENKLSEKDASIKSLQEQLVVTKEHIKQYCDISEGAEKELKILNEKYETYQAEASQKITQYEQNLQALQEKCSELEAELSVQATGNDQSGSNYTLRTEIANLKEELRVALANYENCSGELDVARKEVAKIAEIAQSAEEKYANEMVLHSNDIQVLTQVKEELSRVQNLVNELVAQKNSALEQLDAEKLAWAQRETAIVSENEQLVQRLKDLNEQNALLHDQIQALGTQLSVSHASKSFSESASESANESGMNVSISEEDGKSSEQLFQIVKFLRKEKDIAMAKFDILQAESQRLKSQLEITEKKLDETKLELAATRERSEISMVTLNRQSDILRKVETLNALTDSNRILREERDALSKRVEELTNNVKSLEEKLIPYEERISELTSKIETLVSENNALKADSARWRTRVNALVERANKTSPEDWKRLQNERETLAKMLTLEKENANKVNEELGTVKIEKTKIEEQYTILSRQHNTLAEENKKRNEEIQTLKDDMSRLTEELAKLRSEVGEYNEKNNKLTEGLTSKEAALTDIRNKEMQIRKIAKKYKTQYEELVKSVEEDKKKSEGEAAAAESVTAEASKKMEEQINQLQSQLEAEKTQSEKIKQELETLRTSNSDREEKAKQVLKQAKNKIVQLTQAKETLTRELNESLSKIEAIEQSTRDEQDVRLALIKSQYEGRLARLEKERGEGQAEKSRELENLQQKVAMLQRQLASQASAAKQQPNTEKPTTEPPTANIKPMAGQQSVSGRGRGGETPLASIRPMAQVGPTAPHDAHTTEYMPASSSRPLPRAAVTASTAAASTAPPASTAESTQDMETSEVGMGSSGSNDDSASCSQTPQQAVALVMPRIEQPSTGATSSATVAVPASTSGPSTSAPASTSGSTSAPASTTGSTSAPASTTGSTSAPASTTGSTSAPASTSGSSSAPASTSGPGSSTGPASTSGAGSSTGPASTSGAGSSTGPASTSAAQALPPPAPVSGSTCASEEGVSETASGAEAAGAGVSTTLTRPAKRPRLQQRPNPAAKRSRVQGFERSLEVEYQVPTSSRCDQDDEGVIVVDSEEDDERCTGTMYREGEDEEDMEDEQEVEAGEEEEDEGGDSEGEGDSEENNPQQESPAQSAEAVSEGEMEEGNAGASTGDAAAHHQIEAISSGTEPTGALGLGGNGGDDGDDSIVPSTPTLYVPRRNDGFGEAVVSPVGGSGGAARFTFAEAGAGAASHHDTHADLAAALPPPCVPSVPAPHLPASTPGGDGEENEARVDEETPSVSSMAGEEEGREAEASAPPALRPRPARLPPHHPAHSPQQRWMHSPDSESGSRGRGMGARRRPARRPYMRY